MLKKNLLAIIAVMSATCGMAVASPAPYVGIGTGITTNTTNVKALGSNVAFGNYRGVPINVFAGYGGVINQNFYLAGELSGTLTTASISSDNLLKTSYGYGASIVPGVMLSDHTLAYARAGVVRSHFTNSGIGTRTGGQFGLGLQTSLTQNIDLRGEYDFVAYRSINNTINNVSLSASPRSDQFTLGLVYKFD